MLENSSPIYKIQRYSIHDGPGIRTTLFFQGCPLSCYWCHNPESQAMPSKPIETRQKEINKIADSLMKEIEKDLIFFDDSAGGVTFSGGEPLCHSDLLFRLLDLCRQKEIHTCVDTSGYADSKILLETSRKADLLFYDIKLADNEMHKKYTGKDVSPVLNNLKQLSKRNANIILRFPIIPEMTDTAQNIDGIIAFLKKDTIYRDIHLLPFHRAGEGKYQKLNMKNHMENINPPSVERVMIVKEQFTSKGFDVKIGG